MADILLTTINARYIHSAIGLRYLYANFGELQSCAEIVEFTLTDRTSDIAEAILASGAKIVGIGVYIWNALQVEHLIKTLKFISPDTIIVLGGPEASHLPHRVDLEAADHIICGEGELSFYTLCKQLLEGTDKPQRILPQTVPDINTLVMPYALYTAEDINHRIIYVEASRGCPFQCEFCLSSIDKQVRNFDLELFLTALDDLWTKGARNIKFIDRTFNLGISRTNRILDFFLEKEPPYLVHFEVVPDHFPQALKDKLAAFSPGTLQLEVGIQTLDKQTAANINRKLDMVKIQENLRFLEEQTNAHLHVDLIMGLPGESHRSFGNNLNQLMTMTNAEIQLGVLKKLSGTTLNRHDQNHNMVYSPLPPYDILTNDQYDFALMQEHKRFARFWDIVYNSGNFSKTVRLLWQDSQPYEGFRAFSRWLYQQTQATWQISLKRMAEHLFHYLVDVLNIPQETAANTIAEDILKLQGRRLPAIIKQHATVARSQKTAKTKAALGKRQQKHLL
ncbi:MAG: B12-binding domain-containing radical SAM protein [Desulfobulbus propionicus]|nr:MAG: B12-binding domain-containing radical SAM protein [Desulfobulbus propionicus]